LESALVGKEQISDLISNVIVEKARHSEEPLSDQKDHLHHNPEILTPRKTGGNDSLPVGNGIRKLDHRQCLWAGM